jgi:hypothetical protein
MGMYWCEGPEYLVKVPADHLYRDDLDTISRTGVYHNEKLAGFSVCDDTHCQRISEVERYRPISWYPQTVCKPLDAGRALTEEEHGTPEKLRSSLKELGLQQWVTEEGWYHVEYTDY